MKRYYYQNLDKEKKKEIKEIYKVKYKDTDLEKRRTRLLIYALGGYIFAIIVLVYAFTFEDKKLGSFITSGTLVVVATIYLIGRYLVKLRVLNKIALENK